MTQGFIVSHFPFCLWLSCCFVLTVHSAAVVRYTVGEILLSRSATGCHHDPNKRVMYKDSISIIIIAFELQRQAHNYSNYSYWANEFGQQFGWYSYFFYTSSSSHQQIWSWFAATWVSRTTSTFIALVAFETRVVGDRSSDVDDSSVSDVVALGQM